VWQYDVAAIAQCHTAHALPSVSMTAAQLATVNKYCDSLMGQCYTLNTVTEKHVSS
jgi:hypothetical protein